MEILSLMLSYSNAWKLTAKVILIVVASVMLAATIVLLCFEFFAMRQKRRSAILHNGETTNEVVGGVAVADAEQVESNLVTPPVYVQPFAQSEVEQGGFVPSGFTPNEVEQGGFVPSGFTPSEVEQGGFVPSDFTQSEVEQNDFAQDEVVADTEARAEERLATQPTKRGGKKRKAVAIINVDTIAKNFEADEVVTLEALHQKGLLPKNANSFKLLGRGGMNKPITIVCDNHSVQAKKLISSCGGSTILRKSPMD
jgi:hypothetical protein